MLERWTLYYDSKVLASGSKPQELPFYDATLSKKSEWRNYTLVSAPFRMIEIDGNEVNNYRLFIDDTLWGQLIDQFDVPKERVEFMIPDDPPKLAEDIPDELHRIGRNYEGRDKFWDTYWYRNIGRVGWELGNGIGAVINPVLQALVAVINQFVLIIPPIVSALANIVGHLATSTTHIMTITLQSFHYMIQAWADVQSTDLESKRHLEGVKDTNRVTEESYKMVERTSKSTDSESWIGAILGIGLLIVCIVYITTE